MSHQLEFGKDLFFRQSQGSHDREKVGASQGPCDRHDHKARISQVTGRVEIGSESPWEDQVGYSRNRDGWTIHSIGYFYEL